MVQANRALAVYTVYIAMPQEAQSLNGAGKQGPCSEDCLHCHASGSPVFDWCTMVVNRTVVIVVLVLQEVCSIAAGSWTVLQCL